MTTPAQQKVLDSVGRQGWSFVSSTRATETVAGETDPATGKASRTLKYPEGSETWVITDGRGHNQTMVVKGPARVGDTVQWPVDQNGDPVTPAQAGYFVVDPPNDLPASAANPRTATETNEAALNDERSWNAQNTKWGRVTHAEARALDAKERSEGRQLTLDEQNATRAAANDARTAANQSANTAISAGHLALAQQNAALGQITTVKGADGSTNIVRVKPNGTSEVVFNMPAGVTVQTAQDGTLLAVDPANPTNPQVIWKPAKTPQTVTGVPTTQANILQLDPNTGEYVSKPNPTYSPVAIQRFQELHDGITHIEGMLTRGEVDFTTANKYKDALQKNFDASLRGTTPYQEWQDQQARAQQRAQTATSLLNQRVSSGSGLAQSLANTALGIVGNKNFMDPSAVAGLSIFGGASSVPDFINRLGGGQGVLDSASSAAQTGLGGGQQPMSDPAMALLQAAINKPASQPAGPAYSGENIGSGAASNPQMPMPPPEFAQSDIREGSGRGMPGPQQPQDENDPALALLRAAGMM